LNVEEKYWRRYPKQSKTRYGDTAQAKTASRTFATKSAANSAESCQNYPAKRWTRYHREF
jgi:hypothetical protein